MPRGGYRPGSGRPRRRPIAERMLRIDVRPWRREGLLAEGTQGVVEWRGSEPSNSLLQRLHFRIETSEVVFQLTTDGDVLEQRVRLATGGRRFGSIQQQWFNCPQCTGRVALLYVGTAGLACRRCLGAAYLSQSTSTLARACRQLQQIEGQLGPGQCRPARMRWVTYQRLIGIVRTLELIIHAQTTAVVERFARQ